MYVSSIDVSAGTEDAEMCFRVMSGGTLTGVMSLGYDGNGFGMNLFKSSVSGAGLSQINYPNINNAYFAFGSDLSYSSGSATYKPAGMNTDGNPDPNDGGGDQQLAIYAQDDVSISAGNYGKNGGNDIVFRTTNTAASNPTTRMRIKGDGTIGIGTDSPDFKLDVRDSSYNVLLVSGAGNGTYPILHVKDSSDISTALFEGNRAGDQSSRISLWHNPASAHEGSHTAIVFQMNNDQNAKHNYGEIKSGIDDYTEDTEDGYLAFSQIKAGSLTEGMRINSTGVGIGTTAPDAPLHILKAAGGANIVTALKLDPDDTTTNSGVSIDFNASTTNTGASLVGSRIIGAREGSNASGFLALYTSPDATSSVPLERMRITSAGKVGIGTTAPAAGLHISSTETSQLRITSGSNTQCDFKVSQYGGLSLDVNHTLDLDVTRHIDYKAGSSGQNSRLHRFYNTQTQTLQIELESGGGLLDFKGTQGKIWHATTPVAQIKDDTGFIMEDTMGIKSSSAILDQWPLDAGTGKATATIQGFSKIQNITTAGIDPNTVPSFEVKLPSASVGAEYIIVFGSNQANLSGKALTLIANGSDVLHSGSSTPSSISFSKHTGESIHLIAFESDRWKVLSHT